MPGVLHEKDVLPTELVPICARIPKRVTGEVFRREAKERLSKIPTKPRTSRNQDEAPVDPRAMSYEAKESAERFLGRRLKPLLELTEALSEVLGASSRQADKRFVRLVEVWEKACTTNDRYGTDKNDYFFQSLGLEAALFVLWTREGLKEASVQRFLAAVHAQDTGPATLSRITGILAQRQPLHALAGAQAVKAAALIQAEDDVTHRAGLFSGLAHAMLPASADEASHYFREGLEQLDAIGSGDYDFTNELLLFASEIKGDELDERDFHTLSNVAELNLGEEPYKFFWGAYGRGLAKVAGVRGLAKISRWDDRSRILLDGTLLPYLIGLLEHGKVAPRDALALNRLASPAEYYSSGTAEFADALRKQAGPDPEVITALVEQYQDDNPGTWSESTTAKLSALATEALGPSSELASLLAVARSHHARIIDTRNEQRNYRGLRGAHLPAETADRAGTIRAALDTIVNRTDPADEASLVQAISDFNDLGNLYDFKDAFFSNLRARLDYAERAAYLRHVSALEHLFYYWKLAELKQAKDAWAGSSAALDSVLQSLAVPLINLHADDLISDGRVSSSNINEISEVTGVPIPSLILELIKAFARPGRAIPGPAWLAFATRISPKARAGQGQAALVRLLGSDAAKLANKVTDGGWKKGLYPGDDIVEVAAGLLWRALGSPEAKTRWRAAHSMRDFAAFGNWQVIDAIVAKFTTTTGGPFQAPELRFYYMHARLWLLIALARLARDYPRQVARYKDSLLSIVSETKDPHVLMRHFAAQALLACVSRGMLTLATSELDLVSGAESSPHQRLKKKVHHHRDSYQGRPEGAPEPPFEFHLDYDFRKYDVDSLSRVFGKDCWEVADMISTLLHAIDPETTGMYESGGREPQRGRRPYGMTTRSHNYGQQLGWHGLFVAAAQFLASCPVTEDSWYDEPWHEWLTRYLLTRSDGLWLSDGTDRTPLDSRAILLEQGKASLDVTGDQAKLLSLVGIKGSRLGKELVVEGRWFSADHVRVEVSSALVSPAKAQRLARRVLREEPLIAWLPAFHETEDDDEYRRGDKKEYTPWIVCLSGESRLDEHDPYGVSVANHRPRLARDYAALGKLTSEDPFHRTWQNKRGTVCLQAEAWGRDEEEREEGPHPGLRLRCRSTFLKKVLTKRDMELLLLINLQRYERIYQHDTRYTNSVATVRISKALDVEYFPGKINHLHTPRF